MSSLYLLIPLSVLAMLAILGVFAWALQQGQFDELEGEGARILDAAPDTPPMAARVGLAAALDADQAAADRGPEQSRHG
jgi:cbb3-type cytochrome oxidase maturation protein